MSAGSSHPRGASTEIAAATRQCWASNIGKADGPQLRARKSLLNVFDGSTSASTLKRCSLGITASFKKGLQAVGNFGGCRIVDHHN
jgi:hypothetical protein